MIRNRKQAINWAHNKMQQVEFEGSTFDPIVMYEADVMVRLVQETCPDGSERLWKVNPVQR